MDSQPGEQPDEQPLPVYREPEVGDDFWLPHASTTPAEAAEPAYDPGPILDEDTLEQGISDPGGQDTDPAGQPQEAPKRGAHGRSYLPGFGDVTGLLTDLRQVPGDRRVPVYSATWLAEPARAPAAMRPAQPDGLDVTCSPHLAPLTRVHVRVLTGVDADHREVQLTEQQALEHLDPAWHSSQGQDQAGLGGGQRPAGGPYAVVRNPAARTALIISMTAPTLDTQFTDWRRYTDVRTACEHLAVLTRIMSEVVSQIRTLRIIDGDGTIVPCVHGDLTPAHICFRADGPAYVYDLGSALPYKPAHDLHGLYGRLTRTLQSRVAHDDDLPAVTRVEGTEPYQDPQSRVLTGHVGTWVDRYPLGIILAEGVRAATEGALTATGGSPTTRAARKNDGARWRRVDDARIALHYLSAWLCHRDITHRPTYNQVQVVLTRVEQRLASTSFATWLQTTLDLMPAMVVDAHGNPLPPAHYSDTAIGLRRTVELGVELFRGLSYESFGHGSPRNPVVGLARVLRRRPPMLRTKVGAVGYAAAVVSVAVGAAVPAVASGALVLRQGSIVTGYGMPRYALGLLELPAAGWIAGAFPTETLDVSLAGAFQETPAAVPRTDDALWLALRDRGSWASARRALPSTGESISTVQQPIEIHDAGSTSRYATLFEPSEFGALAPHGYDDSEQLPAVLVTLNDPGQLKPATFEGSEQRNGRRTLRVEVPDVGRLFRSTLTCGEPARGTNFPAVELDQPVCELPWTVAPDSRHVVTVRTNVVLQQWKPEEHRRYTSAYEAIVATRQAKLKEEQARQPNPSLAPLTYTPDPYERATEPPERRVDASGLPELPMLDLPSDRSGHTVVIGGRGVSLPPPDDDDWRELDQLLTDATFPTVQVTRDVDVTSYHDGKLERARLAEVKTEMPLLKPPDMADLYGGSGSGGWDVLAVTPDATVSPNVPEGAAGLDSALSAAGYISGPRLRLWLSRLAQIRTVTAAVVQPEHECTVVTDASATWEDPIVSDHDEPAEATELALPAKQRTQSNNEHVLAEREQADAAPDTEATLTGTVRPQDARSTLDDISSSCDSATMVRSKVGMRLRLDDQPPR
jgi:hypothetical protein